MATFGFDADGHITFDGERLPPGYPSMFNLSSMPDSPSHRQQAEDGGMLTDGEFVVTWHFEPGCYLYPQLPVLHIGAKSIVWQGGREAAKRFGIGSETLAAWAEAQVESRTLRQQDMRDGARLLREQLDAEALMPSGGGGRPFSTL